MRRLIAILVLLAAIAGAGFWFVTRPVALPESALAGLTGDAGRGERVFWAGGCASCHAAKNASGADQLKLGGGQKLVSDFGTFLVPNISSDPVAGIGRWRAIDLANAMLRGISPAGEHLYPAFPYTSYSKASLQDVVDLRAFLATLPPVATPSQPHELGFPFNLRILIGGWKLLFLNRNWVVSGTLDAQEDRGRYLAEALVHCGECHTPRNALGAMERDKWLTGAPNPTGKGHIPNITPAKLTWSSADIVTYLTSGQTPDFDSAGGQMAEVVENLRHLPDTDRAAIAAYLRRVPAGG